MRTLSTRRAGDPGTKRLVRRYGRDLICVRVREDRDARQVLKTVEIVIERAPLRVVMDCQSVVTFRVGSREHLLRRAVLQAGGPWDERRNVWSLARDRALALGLGSRLRRG